MIHLKPAIVGGAVPKYTDGNLKANNFPAFLPRFPRENWHRMDSPPLSLKIGAWLLRCLQRRIVWAASQAPPFGWRIESFWWKKSRFSHLLMHETLLKTGYSPKHELQDFFLPVLKMMTVLGLANSEGKPSRFTPKKFGGNQDRALSQHFKNLELNCWILPRFYEITLPIE